MWLFRSQYLIVLAYRHILCWDVTLRSKDPIWDLPFPPPPIMCEVAEMTIDGKPGVVVAHHTAVEYV